ncbi:uncharacterized protein zmp:0000001301 [Stegostoma tigrinum]|uniref:uncharacterized protein zmp:0000001301 n=1 Tax=Stegostoma tigrinum TaxID=3053191 RepID=UPI0028707605|nr:uncharacterized protein zmp:0000001301 [Stegostoma tigrinum]
MALASGHWIKKEIRGDPPCPRHGPGLAVAGNIAFIFGGCSRVNMKVSNRQSKYFSDFYMLTVTPSDLTWEIIPQSGYIPSSREGHSMCVVKGKIYLFGGRSHHLVRECLPGMYCVNIGVMVRKFADDTKSGGVVDSQKDSLTWEKLQINGIAPRTLNHSAALVGDNIFVFGGIQNEAVSDNLFIFNTVSMTWTPVKTVGLTPVPRPWEGMLSGAVKCKDFGYKDRGASNYSPEDSELTAEQYLSHLQQKWKTPLYVGISPERRQSHAAFVLHSHLYIFGGVNEEQEFNDIKAMKLINPSDRQPIMKEILSEFGINEVGYSFSPTRIPKVKYELAVCPFPAQADSPPPVPMLNVTLEKNTTSKLKLSDLTATESRDLSSIYKQAVGMITNAFAVLDAEFQKLDIEQGELSQAKIAFQQEKEAYNKQYRNQQQELQEMLEKHKSQNEAWLRMRAEQNDQERQELFRQRAKLLQEQDKLHEGFSVLQMRSQQLLSLMQQFKGM